MNLTEIYTLLVLAIIILVNLCLADICYSPEEVEECDNFVKTRRQWGGRQALSVEYQIIPVKYVLIHHTAGAKCSTFSACAKQVRNIQDYHMNSFGWSDIGYNFVVGNDGNVYEGVGWHRVGAHLRGYNSKSIGIAFAGNFNNELPTEAALNATKKLLECGVKRGELDRRYRLLGAVQLQSTESPGISLYNEIQNWDNWSASP